jgi:hypothetical protein
MGIEWLLIATGVAILIALLALSRIPKWRRGDSKLAPLLRGDGKFAYTTRGCIPFSENFEAVRMDRRIYFVEPTLLEVILIPEPSNIEGKLAVAHSFKRYSRKSQNLRRIKTGIQRCDAGSCKATQVRFQTQSIRKPLLIPPA